MQSVSAGFETASTAKIRKVAATLEISWSKDLSPDYNYFTIGVSTIGGDDIIAGDGSIPNEIAYFDYDDETDYVESIEIDRYFENPSSVVRAALDVVLNNVSGRFTPDGVSPIAADIRPARPIRVKLGFTFGSTEYVYVFYGQISQNPRPSNNRSIQIFALDLMDIIADTLVESDTLLTDMRTDEILAYLLDLAGIDSTRYSLGTGATVIPYASFEKGAKVGNIIKKLVQAEGGVFWVDETGMFRFLSRDAWNQSPYNVSQIELTDDIVIAEDVPNVNDIINAVEVTARPRALQVQQPIWKLEGARQLAEGETVEIWATFTDPSTDVFEPAGNADYGSYFLAGVSAEDLTGSMSHMVTISSFSTFSTSAKLTITNNADVPVFLTDLVIFGSPAKVTKELFVRAEDSDSIAEYGERLLQIENNYIQTKEWAYALAKMLVEDLKAYNSVKRLVIRGIPQLQLGDLVTRDGETYTVTRVKTKIDGSNGLTQELTLNKKTVQSYFRIGISAIGGTDIIAP